MGNVLDMVKQLVKDLTDVLTSVLALGIIGALAFGDVGMGIDVIGNVMGLIEQLASMGVVGLIAVAALVAIVNR
ncbi:hypothetical protein OAZ03_00045 [Gammaproteobacteria bacterium]|nr:hypothetical protein [Gammaproteobacteria bacterium]|tara:strand:+ start:239 stop:460 length:222 start_codon:yes stop_codon:yes gene_type:complete